MIRYETAPLHSCQHLFPIMAEITAAVEAERGLSPLDMDELLDRFAKRGDIVALAYEDDQLIGYCLIASADLMMTGLGWFEFRIWAKDHGYIISECGCVHTVYAYPTHWKLGVNRKLRDIVREASPFTHTVSHTFATPEIEAWAASLPGVIDTGCTGPQGDGVYIGEIIRD